MSAPTTHEKVLRALSTVEEYRTKDGTCVFPLQTTRISPYKVDNFDADKALNAGKLIADVFNLTGGSVGDFNIYHLMRDYLLDEDKRKQINRIIGA